jgi:hypothetical protein
LGPAQLVLKYTVHTAVCPAPPEFRRVENEPAERAGNLPKQKATSRSRRQPANSKSWMLFHPARSKSKRLEVFQPGK